MRSVSDRWHGLFSFAVSHFTALGDRSFALSKNLGTGLEFEDSTGIDFLFGGSSPGGMFDLGLRISAGFGPLNRIAWQNELSTQLESSTLLLLGPSFVWHPFAGRRLDPYFGIDLLFTSMGTSKTSTGEVCDEIECVDAEINVPHVDYSGWSFGYVAGVRLFLSSHGRPWWIHFEGRFIQTNWTSLETGDGFFTTPRPEDVTQMNLNQLVFSIGIGVAL